MGRSPLFKDEDLDLLMASHEFLCSPQNNTRTPAKASGTKHRRNIRGEKCRPPASRRLDKSHQPFSRNLPTGNGFEPRYLEIRASTERNIFFFLRDDLNESQAQDADVTVMSEFRQHARG